MTRNLILGISALALISGTAVAHNSERKIGGFGKDYFPSCEKEYREGHASKVVIDGWTIDDFSDYRDCKKQVKRINKEIERDHRCLLKKKKKCDLLHTSRDHPKIKRKQIKGEWRTTLTGSKKRNHTVEH